jgi:hypothetical protein
VEVKIKAILETKAKMYNHHHCFPNNSPGIMMLNFVEKAQNSIAFTFVQ